MSVVQTLIGNIKGPQGDQGPTGATGATGTAATITVGTTTTTAYGNSAQVTNTGTQSAAVLNFVIPQGRPGQQTTTMGDLTLDSITTSMEDFPSPAINDTGKVVFGKIVKFFSDTLSMFTKHAGNVATISSSPTTQAFSAGDFLVYNDQLYKVTANIANGGTLTPGTNITSTSVGTQLDALNDSLVAQSKTYSLQGCTNNASYVFKANSIVYANFDLTATSGFSSHDKIVYNLPAPLDTTIVDIWVNRSGSTIMLAGYLLNTGELKTRLPINNGEIMRMNVVYPSSV